MKVKPKKTRILSVGVSLMLVLSSLPLDVLAKTTTVDGGDTVSVKDYGEDSLTVTNYSIYSGGEKIAVGNETDYKTDVEELLKTINDGEMNASKNGCFEDDEDAKEGIAKITFDVVGKPMKPSTGKDILFVIDESGSMNMGTNKFRSSTCPCLNEDHFYRLPASFVEPLVAGEKGNPKYTDEDGNVYFMMKDLGQRALDIWGAFDRTVLNDYLKTQGLKLKGLEDDFNDWLKAWWPWSNHYYRDSNKKFVKIPNATTSEYCSPVNNSDGCFDRMMMEKDSVKSITSNILNMVNDSRVALVGFNGSARTLSDFSTSETDLLNALNKYTGSGNTHYEDALKRAIELIENRSDKTRVPIVVFISDGEPYPDEQKPTDATLKALKDTNAKVYAVGMNLSGATAEDEIKKIGGSNYKNCVTPQQFEDYIMELYEKIVMGDAETVLTDEVGQDYEPIVDKDHPIMIGATPYYSLKDLPPTVKYSNKTFKFILPEVDQTGLRVSFYTQLSEEKRSVKSGAGTYDTNKEADLSYNKAKVVQGAVVYDDKPTVITLESPYIDKNITTLTASVVSDKMTNNDPTVMGQEVRNEDEITYTITVVNNGKLDATDIVIKDVIPNNSEYVTGSSTGTYDPTGDYITWTIPEVKAGESVDVTFKVKVESDDTDRRIDIIQETFTWGWNDDEYKKTGEPKLDGNKLENPTPLPEPGGILITNTVIGNAADPQKDFHYTITYTSEDGTVVTEQFTLKHGESKQFDNLQAGSTYTVVETDANTDGYTTNMEIATGKIESGKIVQEDYINEKNIEPTEDTDDDDDNKTTNETENDTEIEEDVPDTGDHSNITLWIVLMISAVVTGAIVFKNRFTVEK